MVETFYNRRCRRLRFHHKSLSSCDRRQSFYTMTRSFPTVTVSEPQTLRPPHRVYLLRWSRRRQVKEIGLGSLVSPGTKWGFENPRRPDRSSGRSVGPWMGPRGSEVDVVDDRGKRLFVPDIVISSFIIVGPISPDYFHYYLISLSPFDETSTVYYSRLCATQKTGT